jgi:membrane protease YdiL (CAAX protease family)
MGKKYGHILLAILGVVLVFHALVLLKVIPYDIAWGGRLSSDEEMYVFETVSIGINVFLGWIVMMRCDLVRFKFSSRVLSIILWIFFVLFVLNTIGNIFAKTLLEKSFAILTALSAFLIWKINKRGG